MDRRVRIIFSAFVLVMIGLFAWRVSRGTWAPVNWVMLALSATFCLLVFLRFVYIFNFSYALCAIFNGALIWVARPGASTALVGGAAILYGLRLFWFTWSRTRSSSYAPRMESMAAIDRGMPAAGKAVLWFMCTWLLTFHLMPLWLAAVHARLTAGVVAGAAIMVSGTVLEGVADWQKQRAKRRAADRFVTSGLFARWRHPNYLGEILMQSGLMIVAASCATGPGDLLVGITAPLYIAILMLFEARRIDDYQAARYGSQHAYVSYRGRSGSLLPKF